LSVTYTHYRALSVECHTARATCMSVFSRAIACRQRGYCTSMQLFNVVGSGYCIRFGFRWICEIWGGSLLYNEH